MYSWFNIYLWHYFGFALFRWMGWTHLCKPINSFGNQKESVWRKIHVSDRTHENYNPGSLMGHKTCQLVRMFICHAINFCLVSLQMFCIWLFISHYHVMRHRHATKTDVSMYIVYLTNGAMKYNETEWRRARIPKHRHFYIVVEN